MIEITTVNRDGETVVFSTSDLKQITNLLSVFTSDLERGAVKEISIKKA